MEPSHVLVPLDGSPLADEALAHALATYACRVTVLNVVTPLDSSMSESGVLDVDEPREEAGRRRANRLIEEATAVAEEKGRSVESAVETGEPGDTILEYVADHDVDLVVMGGHGGERGDLVRRLLGTVATKVVAEAPVTVTVVR